MLLLSFDCLPPLWVWFGTVILCLCVTLHGPKVPLQLVRLERPAPKVGLLLLKVDLRHPSVVVRLFLLFLFLLEVAVHVHAVPYLPLLIIDAPASTIARLAAGKRVVCVVLHRPAIQAKRNHLGDRVPRRYLPEPPRHKTAREETPDSVLAEGNVVLFNKGLELLGRWVSIHRDIDSLRQTRALDDLEAVLDGGFLCYELQEQKV
mmetsp:Transcript_40954/g.95654  ORF Transcript_40954/g.95654 Transcript_40954/m.95654 type:complete len:205 (-) Transcript_40954:1126-1740(-)